MTMPVISEFLTQTGMIHAMMSHDLLLSKAALATALLLALVLVRRSRPRKRVIFNF